MLLNPLPSVTNCHTSDPLPLERDVLYGRLNHENSDVSLRSTVIPDRLCTLKSYV